MQIFTNLIYHLDQISDYEEKVKVLVKYFSEVSDRDKLWTIQLLSGKRPSKIIGIDTLKSWALETSGISPWLLEQSQEMVKDWVETVSLILSNPKEEPEFVELAEWIDFVEELKPISEEEKKEAIIQVWRQLNSQERFILNKLIVGSFRFEMPNYLLIKAICQFTQKEAHIIAVRFYEIWHPRKTTFKNLFLTERVGDDLAILHSFSPIEKIQEAPQNSNKPNNWIIRWKEFGIRVQLIIRGGKWFLWNEQGELINHLFPEFAESIEIFDDGTVILGYLTTTENSLDIRLKKKKPTQKFVNENPIAFSICDLLEWDGERLVKNDWEKRIETFLEVKNQLLFPSWFTFLPNIKFDSWEELENHRLTIRKKGFEGILLFHCSESRILQLGAPPIKFKAVLIYAHRDTRGASFVEYSFGIWKGEELVPIAKIHLNLSEEEIEKIESYIKENTIEKFGPVRTVKPAFVFELETSSVIISKRHKSGLLLKESKVMHWLENVEINSANTVEDLSRMIF